MGSFYESKTYMLCVWLFELMKVNVLFVLCSLPVFTLGASTSALYASLRSIAEGGTGATRVFLGTFRKQFKRACCFTAGMIGIVILTVGDICIAGNGLSGPLTPVYIWFPLVFCTVCVVTSGILFPILPIFHAGYVQTMKIAFVFTMRYILRSVLCFAVNLVPVLLLLIRPQLVLGYVPVWLLLGFSFLAYGNTKLLLPVYSEIERLLEEVSNE